jgi:hypothetical protein
LYRDFCAAVSLIAVGPVAVAGPLPCSGRAVPGAEATTAKAVPAAAPATATPSVRWRSRRRRWRRMMAAAT